MNNRPIHPAYEQLSFCAHNLITIYLRCHGTISSNKIDGGAPIFIFPIILEMYQKFREDVSYIRLVISLVIKTLCCEALVILTLVS